MTTATFSNGQLADFSTVEARIVNQFNELTNKKMLGTAAAGSVMYSLWRGTGIPPAGTFGTVGAANGRACNRSTPGSVRYTQATAPNTLAIQAVKRCVPSALATGGVLYLCDRLADVLLAHNEPTGAITGCDGTARLDAGQGGQIICEIAVQLGVAGNPFTLTYDDETGASQTTPTITTTANRAADNSVNPELFQALAAGSKGVRRITAITQAGANAVGQFTAAIVRPLLNIPVPAGPVMANIQASINTLATYLAVTLKADSCLFWLWLPGQTAQTTFEMSLSTMELRPA